VFEGRLVRVEIFWVSVEVVQGSARKYWLTGTVATRISSSSSSSSKLNDRVAASGVPISTHQIAQPATNK